MSTLTTFTAIHCKANKTGGFVWKMSANQSATCFGVTKVIKRTFYIGGMPTQITPGQVIQEDLAKFEVIERQSALTKTNGVMNIEDAQKQGIPYEVIRLKWLHVKAA